MLFVSCLKNFKKGFILSIKKEVCAVVVSYNGNDKIFKTISELIKNDATLGYLMHNIEENMNDYTKVFSNIIKNNK